MIGLLLFFGLAVWLMVAVWISKRILAWTSSSKYPIARGVAVFLLVLIAPVADELIGRWQFHQLCEREAVVTLSPGWEKVKKAAQRPDSRREIDGFLIPIHAWSGDIVDVETGRVFMSSQSLFTDGGFLRRHLYGLDGQATYCHPNNIQSIQQQLNLFELLKKGEAK